MFFFITLSVFCFYFSFKTKICFSKVFALFPLILYIRAKNQDAASFLKHIRVLFSLPACG